jgi:hydrogenase expression/formation protein HypC
VCLAVPGEILRIQTDATGMTTGSVSFGGIVKEVCLAYIEDPQPGEYVIVHAGFAITRIDEAEAQLTLDLLTQIAREADENERG